MEHFFSKGLFQSSSPFNHLVIDEGLGYVSGIIGQMPKTGELISDSFEKQCQQTFENFGSLLEETGLDRSCVVKTTIYLIDYEYFDEMNRQYRGIFSSPYPSRTTLGVRSLPLGAKIQIDAIVRAFVPKELPFVG